MQTNRTRAPVVLRGEDLSGGGLSLEESGTWTGDGDQAAANKSMQVWDKDGRRISSRRLAVSDVLPIHLRKPILILSCCCSQSSPFTAFQ